MTRNQRTRTLILGEPALRIQWARYVESLSPVVVTQPPRAGLVMIKARESAKRSLFYWGEVLVTEAKVLVRGQSGLGLIRGHHPEAALELAIIDAACKHGGELVAEWLSRLEAARAVLETRLDQEQTELRETRVDFETLDQGGAHGL